VRVDPSGIRITVSPGTYEKFALGKVFVTVNPSNTVPVLMMVFVRKIVSQSEAVDGPVSVWVMPPWTTDVKNKKLATAENSLSVFGYFTIAP